MPVLDDVFALILSLETIKPHPSLPKRLGPLLSDLKKSVPSRDPTELAALIHALWISHPNREAADLMADILKAIDQSAPEKAKLLLETLVTVTPDWSEAYFKQAITALMLGHPSEAIGFLGETLRREPRHFAAASLFGQVCIDQDRLYEARAALQIALRLNPHLKGVSETISALTEQLDVRENPLNG